MKCISQFIYYMTVGLMLNCRALFRLARYFSTRTWRPQTMRVNNAYNIVMVVVVVVVVTHNVLSITNERGGNIAIWRTDVKCRDKGTSKERREKGNCCDNISIAFMRSIKEVESEKSSDIIWLFIFLLVFFFSIPHAYNENFLSLYEIDSY